MEEKVLSARWLRLEELKALNCWRTKSGYSGTAVCDVYVYVFVFVFVCFFCFFFVFLISNCLYNVCWKLAVMFSNSNHISNLWFPFRTDHGYSTRLAPAIFGWPWSSLFCNCVNLLYTIIIFNIWGLNKAVVVVVVDHRAGQYGKYYDLCVFDSSPAGK